MSTSSRLTIAATVATLLGSLVLRPTVEGWNWFFIETIVITAMALAGAAVRQITLWWVPVVAAQLTTLTLTLTALFANDEALAGVIPGPQAVRTMAGLLSDGLETTRLQAPPVTTDASVYLVIAAGMALVALAVDLLAVTHRRPAVAGLPLLAVYCVPAAVLPDGLPWYWFVLSALGFLLLISADASDRIRSWGRMLGDSRFDQVPGSGVTRWIAGGGARAGAGALALAIVLPVLVPGLDESIIGGNGTDGKNGKNSKDAVYAVVNPILDLRHDLTARSDRVVLTYHSTVDQPDPLRIVSADVFDGKAWAPAQGTLPPVDNLVQQGLPRAPGLSPGVRTTAERTQVVVGPLNQNFLPLPYPSTRVDVPGPWLYDSRSLNVIGNRVTTRGLRYTVDHLQVSPTAAQLEAAPGAGIAVLTPFTQLPRGVPAVVRETARRQAGLGSAFSQAVRLQEYLRNGGGFAYSEQAPGNGSDDSSLSVMEAFLRERRGYCVHFASAMAVMARTLGIPARVAVGFLPGTQREDGTWEVTVRDAHAWPELFFQGVGWVRFEPTPVTRTGSAPEWTVPSAIEGPGGVDSPVPTVTAVPVDPVGTDGNDSRRPGATRQAFAGIPWPVVAVLVLVVVLALTPMAVVRVRRRLRWRRSADRVTRAETAWEDLRERLGDLGVTWSPARTPRTVQTWLGDRVQLDDDERTALGRLVSDLETARYLRPDAEGGREVDPMVTDVRVVTRGVLRAVPRKVRQRARWLPPSVLGRFGQVRSWESVLEPADPDEGEQVDLFLMDAPR
jgi:transglutaminase-like putative cysteine protease